MKKTFTKILLVGAILGTTVLSQAKENPEGLEIWTDLNFISGDVTFEESSPSSFISRIEYEADAVAFGVGARYQFVNSAWPQLSVSIYGQTAQEMDGTSTDSDFLAPNYGLDIFSESDQEGEFNQWEFNFGWKILKAFNDKLVLDIIAGYYSSSYDFTTENTNQMSYVASAPTALIIGTTTNYELRVKGLFFGLDGRYTVNDKITARAFFRYFPDYRVDATAKWFLRNLLFEHSTDGDGLDLGIAVDYQINENWSVGLEVSALNQETDDDHGAVDNFVLNGSGVEFSRVELGKNDLNFIDVDTVSTKIKVGYRFS